MRWFFSSRRRHTRLQGDWSSDVCSSDLDCSATGQRKPRKHQLLGSPESCLLINADSLRVVFAGPDGSKGNAAFTEELHGAAEQAATDPCRPNTRIDVDLGDLPLEAGPWVEKHAPA